MSVIVIVDDDVSSNTLCERLRNCGHEVQWISSATKALDEIEKIIYADLLILDIVMPWPDDLPCNSYNGMNGTGMEIYRQIRDRNPSLPIIIFSVTQDKAIEELSEDNSGTYFISKFGSPTLREMVQRINDITGMKNDAILPQTFIVHGHDDTTKLELKNFLQNTLKLPEPIILHEKPNGGKTIIEKLEAYSSIATYFFVLLTPDDISVDPKQTDIQKRRGRQNVIFELGYFLGLLGRRSGQVILLYKGPLEIPSDLSGVVYIDIKNGIESVGEQIRKELFHGRQK